MLQSIFPTHPPKGQCIERLVVEAYQKNRRHGLKFEVYTARVIEHYEHHIPEPEQSFEFPRKGKDIIERAVEGAKKLGRYFDLGRNDCRLPANLLPSLVAGLDEPFRGTTSSAIVIQLQPQRFTARSEAFQAFAEMMKECSDAQQMFARLAHDGLRNDSEEDLLSVRVEINQAIAAMHNALGTVEEELARRGVHGFTPPPRRA